MPILTIPLTVDGPIVDVFVMLSAPHDAALRNAGLPVAHRVRGRFLIDTGATCTVINDSFVHSLGLLATGAIDCYTPSTGTTPHTMMQYDVGLILGLDSAPHSILLSSTMPVIATDFSSQPIDGLLGRDVLSQCLLAYNGPNEHVVIAL